ncbi:MAG TPA: hypothetical protein VE057_04735 [Archangium sp.]|nr:hypothetical protein [Archangium sp.]
MTGLQKKWLERASADARKRWSLVAEVPFLPRQRNEKDEAYQQRVGQQLLALTGIPRKGEWWLEHIRRRLIELHKMGLLQWGEQLRVVQVELRELSSSDQTRIQAQELQRKLYAISLKAPKDQPQQKLAERFLSFNPGKRLTSGQLSLQVFINEEQGRPVGMNIQLRGQDQLRSGKSAYLRYDLDYVQMGLSSVSHFRSHWHAGEDPEHALAEDTDPRLPCLLLDPVAALDVLIETFFPEEFKLPNQP